MSKKEIILASASPRRIEMFKKNGYTPIIIPAEIDENLPKNAGMEETVEFLALKKACAIEERLIGHPFDSNEVNSIDGFWEKPLIVAADTIVYSDELGIIGKPKDRDEAFEILSSLNGKRHYVATGVCVLEAGGFYRNVFCDVTEVYFKKYKDSDINKYLDTDEPYDKAGAYAIQGAWGKYVDHYDGDYDNIVGLPWYRVVEYLK